MLAGLPKAPSTFNPVTNPKRAKTRQLYVLRRMHELRFLTDAGFKEAQSAPLAVRQGIRDTLPTHGESVAEMARQVVFDAYGDEAYTRGITVWTTVRKADQEAAYAAVRRGVLDYDRRHGYRGPEAYVNLPAEPAEQDQVLDRVFAGNAGQRQPRGRGGPGGDRRRGPGRARERRHGGPQRRRAQVRRAQPDRQDARGAAHPARRRHSAVQGRQEPLDDRASCRRPRPRSSPSRRSTAPSSRSPAGSTTSATSSTTSPRRSASRARRSSPSSIRPRSRKASRPRPSSTMRRSSSPATRPAARTGSPRTTTASSTGRCACARPSPSPRTSCSVRVLQAIGPQYAQDYIARFGFDPKQHPPYLTMGLGAGSATPLQMAAAYAVFANGGYRDRAVPHRARDRRQGQRAVRSEAGRRRRRAPSARSTRATRS